MFYLFGVVCALFLSAFFSGFETAAYSANKLRLAQAVREGNRAAVCADGILANLPLYLSTLLIGNNVVNSLGTQFFTYYLLDARVKDVELAATLIMVPLFFFFGETFPKQLAFAHANRYLLAAAGAFRRMHTVCAPLSYALSALGNGVNALFEFCGVKTASRTGRGAFSESLESFMMEGCLSEEQVKMSNRIMEIEDTEVANVMEPLGAVCQIDENLPAFTAGQAISARGLMRALLVDSRGRFTGAMFSLNSVLRDPELRSRPAWECARPVPVFTPHTPLAAALDRLRREGAPLALVRRRNGECVGALSLNRLISCVVSGVENRKWNL